MKLSLSVKWHRRQVEEQPSLNPRGGSATSHEAGNMSCGGQNKTKFLPAAFAWSLLLSITTLFFYFPWVHSSSEYQNVPIAWVNHGGPKLRRDWQSAPGDQKVLSTAYPDRNLSRNLEYSPAWVACGALPEFGVRSCLGSLCLPLFDHQWGDCQFWWAFPVLVPY